MIRDEEGPYVRELIRLLPEAVAGVVPPVDPVDPVDVV